ncbi:MAG: response regulator transcription factor [Bacteroidetes bacterium]|nr:response regulator transcription factor [Bacteroidota bacterium]
MNILIVEDESASAARLTRLLKSIDPELTILAVLESVEDSVQWVTEHGQPDLFFLDIQLADGLSFELFDYCEITAPVIFTTAFDEYILDAFRVTSIDYLMKPIERRDLERALDKWRKLEETAVSRHAQRILTLQQHQAETKTRYKTRFLVKKGIQSVSLPVQDIAGAVIKNQVVFLINRAGKRFLSDLTLDQFESLVNPADFFRINRQVILRSDSVLSMEPYFNSRLILKLIPGFEEDPIVARERVAAFKSWLDG